MPKCTTCRRYQAEPGCDTCRICSVDAFLDEAEAAPTQPVTPSNSSGLLSPFMAQVDEGFALALETMTALHGMLIAAGLVGETEPLSGEKAVQIATKYLQKKGL